MEVRVNNLPVMDAKGLVKLDPKRQIEALNAAAQNRADDVFFKVAGDVYVASGERLKQGVKVGDEIQISTIKGQVMAIDDETPLKNPIDIGAAATSALSAGLSVAAGEIVARKAAQHLGLKSPGKGLAYGARIVGAVAVTLSTYSQLDKQAKEAADYKSIQEFKASE